MGLRVISQGPSDAHRIQCRQTLGLKLGIFADSQLDRLVPKQAASGVSRPAPPLKRTTRRLLIGLLVQKPDPAPLVPPLYFLSPT